MTLGSQEIQLQYLDPGRGGAKQLAGVSKIRGC